MGQGTTSQPTADQDVAFVPLAMPIMVGPGAIATILGMESLAKRAASEVAAFIAISAAICATMLATYLVLLAAKIVLSRVGPWGIDAATRIVGFLFPPWAWG